MRYKQMVYKFTAFLMAVVFPLQVLAGACDTLVAASGPMPGALGVLKDGTITVQSNGESNCAILFGGNSTVINAQTGKYTTRGTGCSTSSGGKVAETGEYLNALSPMSYTGPSANAAKVTYANSGGVIKFTSSSVEHSYALKDSSSSSKYRWCKNGTGNGCDNNQKGSDYIVYDSHLNSDWGTFPVYGSTRLTLTNDALTSKKVYLSKSDTAYQDLYGYELVDVNTGNEVYFKYDSAASPYRISKLRLSADNATVTFEPGTYYIGTLETTSKFVIKVASSGGDGTGKVKLYVDNMSMNNLNGSCINVSSCPSSGVLNTTADAEHPERLYIYVLSSDFTLNDRVSMAAGIYVQKGTLTMGNNNATFIGEALAKNILLQNGGSSSDPMDIIYKDTGIFSSLYSTSSVTTEVIKKGTYSLAAPAVPRETTSGNLVYVPYQTDYYLKDDGSYSYYGGHLMAFKLKADGTTETTAQWDAGTLMTVAQRTDRLYSINSSGALTKFALLDSAAFGSTSPTSAEIISYTLNPSYTATFLGKRDPNTMIGRPYSTQPVIAENLGQVMFHTDDGFLYSVDSTTGELKWGFMPGDLVASLKDYGTFYKSHAMEGQIAVQEYTSGGTKNAYVVGSAKGGSIHYALNVSSSGTLTNLWADSAAGSVPHRPVIFQVGSTYYALYLTGTNTVNVRALTSGATAKQYTLATGTLTAAPIVLESFDTSGKNRVQNLTMYVGDADGNVYEYKIASGGSLINSPSKVTVGNMGTTSTVADPVKYLQTATLGGYDYVTAQTTTRLKTFRLPNSSTWASRWISRVGESGSWSDSGTYTKETLFTPKSEHIQKLPTLATITDQVEIAESVVFLPVQVEETSGTEQVCNAYYYLYRLDKGYFPYNTLHTKTPVTDNVLVGTGKAYKPSITIIGGEVTLEGHSERNIDKSGVTNLGLDDPFTFTKGENGISGWRELLDE
ncbi:hypothetical protein [Parathalassolituus penaei]|uniref:Uncharacterized protein n=1 Tax=Parathalassolituus penaei TaxID=2997323 RepID=A0A9X3EDE4_9GAMM|nr:hypothetical protein [Parathalassolituus penaei]MCY0965538.1 hypothetical protein [Parathalassolituus penaei]